MKKIELFRRYETLLNDLGMHRIDGINWNSRKRDIENAIDCLQCPDETLNDYITIIKLKYPNTYKTIVNNGNWKTHYFNRYYVFNTAKMILRG